MEPRIIIIPLAEIDGHVLEMLGDSLRQTFACQVKVEAQVGSLDYAYNKTRKQYLAAQLLSILRHFSMEPGDRCLGIVDVDLYAPGLNFIFGEADVSAGVAIISLYRLQQERYGLPRNERLFQDRAIKEAVHELGHTYYLSHCREARCVMHFSNSLADTDIKRPSFCEKCQQKLGEARA
jgi:archaemetzincin